MTTKQIEDAEDHYNDFPTYDEDKEKLIQQLLNCGGVNKSVIKAGETWHYHFDKDCTVLLVFE